MYKIIYINETPLVLIDTARVKNFAPEIQGKLVAKYTGKPKSLLHYVDMLEKSQRFEMVVLHANDAKALYQDFKKLFKRIKAAGGLVFNPKEEALLIYRRNIWDLPKGKIDKGEKKKAAAIREVREETGIHYINIGPLIASTLHTYRDKSNRRILKKTYWYYMETPDLDLIPQTEEDIEAAQWMALPSFLAAKLPTYKSVLSVINTALNKF